MANNDYLVCFLDRKVKPIGTIKNNTFFDYKDIIKAFQNTDINEFLDDSKLYTSQSKKYEKYQIIKTSGEWVKGIKDVYNNDPLNTFKENLSNPKSKSFRSYSTKNGKVDTLSYLDNLEEDEINGIIKLFSNKVKGVNDNEFYYGFGLGSFMFVFMEAIKEYNNKTMNESKATTIYDKFI